MRSRYSYSAQDQAKDRASALVPVIRAARKAVRSAKAGAGLHVEARDYQAAQALAAAVEEPYDRTAKQVSRAILKEAPSRQQGMFRAATKRNPEDTFYYFTRTDHRDGHISKEKFLGGLAGALERFRYLTTKDSYRPDNGYSVTMLEYPSGNVIRYSPVQPGWVDPYAKPKKPIAKRKSAAKSNPSPLKVGARVRDEYGNVGTIRHCPTSRGGMYHVDMDPIPGKSPLSGGTALLMRSEIRPAGKKNPRAPEPRPLASYGQSKMGALADVAALRRAGKLREAYALMAKMAAPAPNPRSKSLTALRKLKGSKPLESTRLRGIKALGVSTANGRTDIDPAQYSFERRGFVGSANDNAPRSRDIALFEQTYPDHTWAEIQAFSQAHSRVMYLRVRDAMKEAHGADWHDRAHRNPSAIPSASGIRVNPRRPTKAELDGLIHARARLMYAGHAYGAGVHRKLHAAYMKALAKVLKKLEASTLSPENQRGIDEAATRWWNSRAFRGPGVDW